MCTSIWIDTDDNPIDSIGDLVRRFGWENVAWIDKQAKAQRHMKPLTEVGGFCLCQIDIQKMAHWLGYTSTRDDDGDLMRQIWSKTKEKTHDR